ncbi:MAG: hypothetical protein HY270_10060 [Deltaproteobacteria bacterium]|nr:hypothetical protein [Deltaproteobacteria bacterium]
MAVGGREFVARVEADLGARVRYRNVEMTEEGFMREPGGIYKPGLGTCTGPG